jgi:hypothetical protein
MEASNATEVPFIVLPFGPASSHRISATRGQSKVNDREMGQGDPGGRYQGGVMPVARPSPLFFREDAMKLPRRQFLQLAAGAAALPAASRIARAEAPACAHHCGLSARWSGLGGPGKRALVLPSQNVLILSDYI